MQNDVSTSLIVCGIASLTAQYCAHRINKGIISFFSDKYINVCLKYINVRCINTLVVR